MNASHEQNQPLADEVKRLATQQGLDVVHNTSSFSNFDGYHRYLIFDPRTAKGRVTIRSKATVDYWESRYSKNYQPSISGEAECLREMIEYLS